MGRRAVQDYFTAAAIVIPRADADLLLGRWLSVVGLGTS